MAVTTLVYGGAAAAFSVVLSVALSILLLSYLVNFPTVVRLGRRCLTLPGLRTVEPDGA